MKRLLVWTLILICLLGWAAPAYGATDEEAWAIIKRVTIEQLSDYCYELFIRKGDIADTGDRERPHKDLEDETIEMGIFLCITVLKENGYTQEEIDKLIDDVLLELIGEQYPTDLLENNKTAEEVGGYTESELKELLCLCSYEIAVRSEILPNDGREQRPFVYEDDDDLQLAMSVAVARLKADFGYTEEEITELSEQLANKMVFQQPGQYPVPEETD